MRKENPSALDNPAKPTITPVTICGEIFDMRKLDQVLDHLHGQEVEEQPTQH